MAEQTATSTAFTVNTETGRVRLLLPRALAASMFIGLIAAAPAPAQVLWGELGDGMTVEKVMAAVPEATKIVGGETLGPLNPASELLEIKGERLGDYEARATLYFSDESHGLVQVMLAPVDDLSFDELRVLAEALTKEFRKKYGKEVFLEEVSPKQPVAKFEADWMAGDLNINVVAFDIGGTAGVLNVNYRNKSNREH